MSNSIGIGFSQTSNGKSGFTTGGIGFSFPIPGIGLNINVNNNPVLGPYIGGGLKGLMPQPIIDHDNSDSFARTRFTLRDAWNTTSSTGSAYPKRIITPFRAVNNAGDLLSRENYSCGGTCQTPQSRPGLSGLKQHLGSTSTSCNSSVIWSGIQIDPNTPSSTCNVKYVYDGSDYTKFKKNLAINKNYNDRSFGGNDYNTSQSTIRHSKRY